MAAKVLTWEEVCKHQEEDNVWLVIDNKVYDVSAFKEHPGGYELLVDNAGIDASEPFADNDHSQLARDKLATYFIGNIEDGPAPKKGTESNLVPALIMLSLVIAIIALVTTNII
jgi:cytochrome b involved in lipid metabolism